MSRLRRYLSISLIGLVLSPLSIFAVTPTQWQPLANGLQTTTITPDPTNPTAQLRAFRIDLHQYTFSLKSAKNLQQTALFVDQVANEKNVLLAINGGFFSPDLKPLGLRISHGELLNPLKKVSWWGIFLLRHQKAMIIPENTYRDASSIDFAVQAGPRLVVNGVPTKLRGGESQRSALGITKDGKVIVVITDNILLSTQALALLISRSENNGGLACYQALNLDGGSSSQLYAHVDDFSVHIRSLRPVADIVMISKN